MTTDILKDWMKDMPMQFLGKKNIEILIKAFARQMQELDVVFEELNTKTDIDTATGQNLDYVGTIIPLTRKEAGELAGINGPEPVISDERYRQYLRYKMLKNTSECTYHDIMNAIEILWDVEKASYYERPDRPAAIFIGLPSVDIEDDDQAAGKPTILKPAGVGFFYTAWYGTAVDQSRLERVEFTHMDVQAFFYYFKRILNGGWLLDGSVSLGQIPICETAMGLVMGAISAVWKGKASAPALDISAAFPAAAAGNQYSMENGWRLDSSGIQDAGMKDAGVNIPVRVDAGVGAESVTIEKDLWRLDGQVLMDGSRILDAEVWEEEF